MCETKTEVKACVCVYGDTFFGFVYPGSAVKSNSHCEPIFSSSLSTNRKSNKSVNVNSLQAVKAETKHCPLFEFNILNCSSLC